MNQSIRPTVFEFSKHTNSPKKQSPKGPLHNHFKTKMLTTPFKASFLDNKNSTLKNNLSPIKNFGLAATDRKSSNFSICQFQEIPPIQNSPFTRSAKKSVRTKYFNEAQLRKIGFSLRANSKVVINNSFSGNSSLKTVLEEIWKEPSDLIEKKRQKFSLNAKMRRSLKKSAQSCEARVLLKTLQEPSNCVCIQTDDLEFT